MVHTLAHDWLFGDAADVTTNAASPKNHLARRLDWLDAAAIFVGIILGSGIFEAPATVAGAAGGAWLAAAMWLVGALVAAAGASCYAECGARLPRTGGFFIYYRAAYGEGAAFVGGWAALLITYPASLAAIAHIFARYLVVLFPALNDLPHGPELAAAAGVALSGTLNLIGVRASANAQRLLTGFKVVALATLCLAALVAAPVELTPTVEAPPIDGLAILGAMVLLLWTYDGWSDVTLIGGELRRPGRDLGRTVLVGVAVLGALYLLVQLAVLQLLPAAVAANSKQVVADAVSAGLGPGVARLVAALVVVSAFGSLHGVVLTASRLGFAMAEEGVFWRGFAAVHPRFGTPARSIVALAGAALVYVFVADFRNLLAFFSFNVWLFYGATAVALWLLRRRRVGEPPEWRAPGGALAPFVLLTTGLAMTAGLAVQSPARSAIGLGMLLAGIPLYLVWRWRAKHGRSAADGLF